MHLQSPLSAIRTDFWRRFHNQFQMSEVSQLSFFKRNIKRTKKCQILVSLVYLGKKSLCRRVFY